MKFRDRYVLGVGYPSIQDSWYETLCLFGPNRGGDAVRLKAPFWMMRCEDNENNLEPKYRLILEKVKRIRSRKGGRKS